jgi:hypothetical protein
MSIPKIFLALFLFISVTQISCKKDSDASIVGKWTLESYREKISSPSGSDEDIFPGEGETSEFRSDGTGLRCSSGGCQSGYYRVSGKTLTVSATLDFTDADTYTIQTLTSNKLVLYSTFTDTDGGQTVTYEYWDTFTR